ncbi:P-loop nucleotide/nucleoside kinase family protein [Microlunatus parietis]|uniref:Putative kinase n=1 Tax=Microlunatus parietis TaxID=682979 RepID=A0A7Y9LAS4_9ACTN|nr:ATP-binding protein [Microlunatus parietis]NYE73139.1 putative kinase [Microlunatus parietis]
MSRGIVLLCGRAFSGKSTVAGQLANGLPGMIISLDAINAERGLWGGDGIPIAEWARTLDLAHDRVTEAVGDGTTVIIDDTSSPAFLRDRWRERAAALAVPLVLVYVEVDEATLRERVQRNRADRRRGDVTDAVLAEHLASFEPPTEAEAALVVDGATPAAKVVAAVRKVLTAPR